MKKHLSHITLVCLFLFCLILSGYSQILIVSAKEKANDSITINQRLQPSNPLQNDLNWAVGLQQRFQEGYKPTAKEIELYTAIYARYQQQKENDNVVVEISTVESDEEMKWALQLIDSFTHGFIPTSEQIKKYEQIFERWNQQNRIELATPYLQKLNTDTTVKKQSNKPSDKEIEWAKQLEKMVGQGYTPNAQENAQYEDIFNRLNALQSNEKTKSNPIVSDKIALPVTQQEIEWALQLEQKAQKGYNPNAQETTEYENIAKRLSGQKANENNNKDSQASQKITATVSQQEIQWALQLEEKVKQGHNPNTQETGAYENIANRLRKQQTNEKAIPDESIHQPVAPSPKNDSVAYSILIKKIPDEINWALMIEQKANSSSYQPSAEETALYQSIATKLSKIENAEDTTENVNVSNVELDWALQVQIRNNKKQNLLPEEINLYENIYKRWSTKKLKPLHYK